MFVIDVINTNNEIVAAAAVVHTKDFIPVKQNDNKKYVNNVHSFCFLLNIVLSAFLLVHCYLTPGLFLKSGFFCLKPSHFPLIFIIN